MMPPSTDTVSRNPGHSAGLCEPMERMTQLVRPVFGIPAPRTWRAAIGWLAVFVAVAAVAAEDPPITASSTAVSVRDFGAVGDGVADDSGAFQKAFEQAVMADHAVVRIPAGAYRLDRRVSVDFRGAVGNGLTVAGDGQGVSVIHCANTDGALRIRSELCMTQVTIRDLTFLAEIPDAGTALEVSSSLRGVRNYRTLTVQDVDMRGSDLPTRKFFSRGLLAFAQWRPLFQNVVFSGVVDPSLNEPDQKPVADALREKPEYGVCADWCYAPSFQHCYAWSCHTGYRVVSRDLKPEGPEDGAFYRCTAVGTRIGIDVDTPIREPQLVIDACHLNCREAGVRLRNRKFFHITNCLFYGGNEAYTDIALANCWAGIITGNIFHSPDPGNMRKEPPSQRVCVEVDPQSTHISITGNTFNGKGEAVRVGRGAQGILISDNQIINRHVIAPPDESAGPASAPGQ
jgi:hypothetical protein